MSRQKKQCEWGQHEYAAAPSKIHPGYIATACVKCGKFLGRCPEREFQEYGPGSPAPGGRYSKDRPVMYVAPKPEPKRRRKTELF